MIDEPQGWWQASDLKWYPPEVHADYVAPLPPPPKLPPPPSLPPPSPAPVTPTQPPVTTKGLSDQPKVVFVVAGLALLALGVQAVLASAPALLVAVAIVIIGVTIAVRSGQSGARKVMFVLVLVLALFLGPVVSISVRKVSQIYGGGSPNSSSFCADFLHLWDGAQGVSSAIVADRPTT
jgi:hypothetical protein